MKQFNLEAFLEASNNATILDIRSTEAFKQGYIPGSIHVPGTATQFIEWVKAVLDTREKIILVAAEGAETAAETQLMESGYTVEGYLKGGFETYEASGRPVDLVIDVEPDELMMDIPFDDHLVVVDVRNPMEYAEGHLADAVNLPLADLKDPLKISSIEDNDNLYLHCGGGIRSVIAASVLKKHGIHNLRNVAGGWKKIKEEPKAKIIKEPGLLN